MTNDDDDDDDDVVVGGSDGADAGVQSRSRGHRRDAVGSRRRRERPGRRWLDGVDVCRRARLCQYRQDASCSSGLRFQSTGQRQFCSLSNLHSTIMNSTNETLLFDRFLIMYDLCVFTCIIFIFVFR